MEQKENHANKEEQASYVYILKCADGSLYTGWTTNLAKRVAAHNKGTASKCTRTRLPAELVYFEQLESKSEALKREAAIKKLKRMDKLRLTEDGQLFRRQDREKREIGECGKE